VCIHGVGSDSRVWERLAALLEPKFRVVTVDLPGISLLRLADPPRSLPSLALTIDAAMVERNIQRYSIVGHSFGAAVGLMCAQAFPAHVEGLSLISPGGFGPELNPVLRLMATRTGGTFLRFASAPSVRRRVARAAERYREGPRGVGSIDELMETYERLQTKEAQQYFRRSIVAAMQTRAEYAEVSVVPPEAPVQILWGERDLVLPVWQAERAAADLDARSVHIIPGAGHAPHRTHPAVVAQFIREFAELHITAANQLPLPFADL
jgi:pimeloyl-ACP methyl ester carboxylesterase